MRTAPAERYLCLHGHFYQPPRENPWTGEVDPQESASPYHDWNERVTAECYRPNAAARILDGAQRIRRFVNNYAQISFDFGPTLLAWLERHAAETYRRILDADRASRARFSGHGSALAQAWAHPILPLCNARDRETQVVWGLRDFAHRFGRPAHGLWLPETAADRETLDVLARHGVRFAVLAPSQAAAWRRVGDPRYTPVEPAGPDPRRAYRLALPAGRSIAIFFYDGAIAREIAFGSLLDSGPRLVERLRGGFRDEADPEAPTAELVHVATDGETYGHHHTFGEMALAWALEEIERAGTPRLTNYGEFLDGHPPEHEVEIHERTAWSCAHGLGRWSEDCGCALGSTPGWRQHWRAPLRQALDWLRDELAARFERDGARWLRDPWAARECYVELLLDGSAEAEAAFFSAHGRGEPAPGDRVNVRRLLEMQRHALLMYASCAWFFDEVSGIETVQALRHAARAAELGAEVFGEPFPAGLAERLARVPSNRAEYGDARRVLEREVEPARVDLRRAAAHHAACVALGEPAAARLAAFAADELDRRRVSFGESRLVVGRIAVAARDTGERARFVHGFLHSGGLELCGGIRECVDESDWRELAALTTEPFARGELDVARRRLDDRLGGLPCSLATLLPDAQRTIVRRVLEHTVAEVEAAHELLYRRHAPVLRRLAELGTPAPRLLGATAELVLTARLRRLLRARHADARAIGEILDESARLGVALDPTRLDLAAGAALARAVEELAAAPRDAARLAAALDLARELARLPFPVELARAQELFYSALEVAGAAADAGWDALGATLHVAVGGAD